jgi:Ca-activated chloride channel family protein
MDSVGSVSFLVPRLLADCANRHFLHGLQGRLELIGYENRLRRTRDFTDDQKDAGDLGSGAAVTALYELRPASDAADGGRVVLLRVRYKDPEESTSKLLEVAVRDAGTTLSGSSPDFKFAGAVAEFGLLLRQSPHRSQASFSSVLELAHQGRGEDARGHRSEFTHLVEMAEILAAGK